MRNKIRVAVLRGGPSSEYEVSLKTGAGVLANLDQNKYEAIDVLIDKEGQWHVGGVFVKPEKIARIADVCFIALHGNYGEDGTVQKILEAHGIPYTGSKILASALGMNKILTKKILTQYNIPTPHSREIEKKEDTDVSKLARELFTTFIQPSIVKPAMAGSSVGVSLVRTLPEMQSALEEAFKHGDKVLIEEFIKGKEATCGVLEHFRGKEFYPLIPVEILPQDHQAFFDFEAKYSDVKGAHELCPGRFTKQETEEIERLAVEVHKALGARHYSRVDFMVHPKRGVFCLEINTLPGLTPTSLLPKEMVAVGSSYSGLLDHLIGLALEKK